MKIFYYCLPTLAVAWLIHFGVWRVSLPKKQTRALLVIFLSTIVVTLVASLMAMLPKLTWIELLHVMIFYIPTSLAYVCFYSAIEEDSPSIGLIQLTKKNIECRLEDYYSIINSELLIESRLGAMIRDGLLIRAGDNYQLTMKGTRLGHLFSVAHDFLKLNEAG